MRTRTSSLAAYRIGEVFFHAAQLPIGGEQRFAMRCAGDGDPKWVEVWSHVELGRIFDVTGQRDRAVNEYRLAVSEQRQHAGRGERGAGSDAEAV